jgi:NAD(P)-dependent dehydrogenase (short-subunit alcohol dehydrogenase family)
VLSSACYRVLNRGDSLEALDFDGMRHQFQVNTMGPLRAVKALLPKLGSGSKVVLVTSRMGSIEDNTSGAYYGYRVSKAGLNQAGMSLSIDLNKRNSSVGIFHPGYVVTYMTAASAGAPNMISTTESVTGMIAGIDKMDLQNSGTFWHTNGQVLPW